MAMRSAHTSIQTLCVFHWPSMLASGSCAHVLMCVYVCLLLRVNVCDCTCDIHPNNVRTLLAMHAGQWAMHTCVRVCMCVYICMLLRVIERECTYARVCVCARVCRHTLRYSSAFESVRPLALVKKTGDTCRFSCAMPKHVCGVGKPEPSRLMPRPCAQSQLGKMLPRGSGVACVNVRECICACVRACAVMLKGNRVH